MAKTFKVKSKERKAIQRAIERQIQKYGLVDTFAMKDSVRIAAGSRVSLNKVYITVVALYYYRFHDTFASNGFSTKNGINPVDITIDAFQDPRVQETLATIYEQYDAWLRKEFPLMGIAKIKNDPEVLVGFEFYGSPDSKWNKAVAFETLMG
jgi:hypothetical protein